MYLRRLALQHFRNIAHADLEPNPGFNILWGENAQGKTNILEGVYLLATLRSFRSARNDEMVRHEADTSRLAGDVQSRGVRSRLELSLTRHGKTIQVNGKEVGKPAEYFGCLQPVLFSPEEVMLVKGPPAGRRALIDRAIFQTDVTFLNRAREFDRCLKQRNRLLRDQAGGRELTPWTQGLIRTGARIRFERNCYIERLQPLFTEAFRQIADGEKARIDYLPQSKTVEDLEKELAAEIDTAAERELRLGQSLAGPHRDDPLFLVNGKPLKTFGSQGQQRTFLLAFKTAQVRDLENITGEPPPLLLDDLTSELDSRRRNYFFRFLLDRRGQVFITTTDIGPLLEHALSDAQFFKVEGGALRHDSRQ